MAHRIATGFAVGALLTTGFAWAQGDGVYRTLDAPAGQGKLLGYYGTVAQDCTIGVLPEIVVRTHPQHGVLAVRTGKVKMKPASRCPNLEVPVRLMLYQAQASYVGADEVAYEVRSPNGKSQTQAIKLNVVKGGTIVPHKPKNEPTDL